jgi:hypothetical protein
MNGVDLSNSEEVIARLHNAAERVEATDLEWHYIKAFATASELFVTDYLEQRRAGVPAYQWIDPETLR